LRKGEERPEDYTEEISIWIIRIGAWVLQFYAFLQVAIGNYFHFITIGVCGFALVKIRGQMGYRYFRRYFESIGDDGWAVYFKSPIIRYMIWAAFISLPLFIFIYERLRLYFIA
jgi:hypothetical protein